MNRKTSSVGIIEGTWQILGELEITVGLEPEPELSTWLLSIFRDLNLRADFQDRVLRSVHEGVSQALQAGTTGRFEHLHLFIFIPASLALNNHNWWFYKIEKVDNTGGKARPDHSIEFYLYQDGK